MAVLSPFNEPAKLTKLVQRAMQHQHADGLPLSHAERVGRFVKLMEANAFADLVPALGLLLNLKGKPYTLDNHFPFECLFRFQLPSRILYKTGRQVAKSTSMSAHGVVSSASIPDFTTLYVMPLYEQVRRFSTMFIAPFIDQSPAKRLWQNTDTVNSVLHRSFANRSKMLFSFAFLSADRLRGISADKCAMDEIQDLQRDHLPIIRETLSASQWAIQQFTGTPKTLDNTIQKLWEETSQAEWFIPCFHCTTGGHPTYNIPALEYHAERMIGPWHRELSEKMPATICHKCGKHISPRFGRWIHRYPRRIREFPGYHIPQIIMPLHYADHEKWSVLLQKQQGKGNTPPNVFWNEVIGESYDTSAKIVTLTELNAVSNLGPCTIERAREIMGNYRMRVLAVDWGGGGEKGLSFTVVALLGLRHNGCIDVLWGKRLLTPHDHILEAIEIKQYWDYFKPHLLAHDYTGAGALRETFLIQAGVPLQHIFPAAYVRSSRQSPCYHVGATEQHPREHYRVDKARTLQLTCGMIKVGALRFFDSDYVSQEDPGLILDFLSLVEDKVTTMAAGEVYKIGCQAGMTDDFAQAVNIGCVSMWYYHRAYPNLADMVEVIHSPAQLANLQPITEAQEAALEPDVPDWQSQPEDHDSDPDD